MRVSASNVFVAFGVPLAGQLCTGAALFSCSFLVFLLFLSAENVMKNNMLQCGRATDLWSSATDLWFRAYRFMVICYRNMVLSTGARRCCYKFMVPGLHPLPGAVLLQIYGRRPGLGSCYRFMVASVPGDSATDLWSLARWHNVTTKFAR